MDKLGMILSEIEKLRSEQIELIGKIESINGRLEGIESHINALSVEISDGFAIADKKRGSLAPKKNSTLIIKESAASDFTQKSQ